MRCAAIACSLLCLFACGLSAAESTNIPSTTLPGDTSRWYDARDLDVEGRGWSDVKEFYDRLPGKAEGKVRDAVWGLSRNSSGMCVRFAADTPSIAVQWVVRATNLAMPHMAATGVSGVDLYGRTDAGSWRWIASGRPTAVENKATLISTLPKGLREYRLYLPLYNGVKSVLIGLPANATMARSADPALQRKPIVFYGTSIMQGACASRTGMAQSSIVGRRLNVPIINLGFSGNGKMEPEVAELLAELDPAAYVLDALPNMESKLVAERAEPFVQALRKAHPDVPIVLVEDRTYADSFWVPARRERNNSSRREFRAAYERLQHAGVNGLHYVEGNQLLGDDGEDTVDGSHPTDVGFIRYADVLTPILAPLVK